MGAPYAILDGTDHAFGLRDVFVGSTDVELGENRAKGLKFVVRKDGNDPESTLRI
jgi:hypothetical protein